MTNEDRYDQAIDADISATGTLVQTAKKGYPYLSVQIANGDAAASYQVEVSQDETNWYPTDISFNSVTSADGGGVVPERHARLVVTTPAAGGTDTADVLLTASP